MTDYVVVVQHLDELVVAEVYLRATQVLETVCVGNSSAEVSQLLEASGHGSLAVQGAPILAEEVNHGKVR